MLTLKKPLTDQGIYTVCFEDYLQPRKFVKCTELQQFKGVLQVKPVGSALTKDGLTRDGPTETPQLKPESIKLLALKPNKWQLAVTRWQQMKPKDVELAGAPRLLDKLPNWLAFLRARNDDGLCKRKTGFEIYCEMASFHGFTNFVDASTWQRAFWFLIICAAIVMSLTVLVMSHLLNLDTPTMIYTESTTYPTVAIPFPAVTICSLNRISRRRAIKMAAQFAADMAVREAEVLRLFPFAFAAMEGLEPALEEIELLAALLEANNYTLAQLRQSLEPHCMEDAQVLRCKWRGELQPCGQLLSAVATTEGNCCTFNYQAEPTSQLNYVAGCAEGSGLSLLLQGGGADIEGSAQPSADYEVFIHDAWDWPTGDADRLLLAANTVSSIAIEARQTYATSYVRAERVQRRRCYFADERPLQTFQHYTQANCLAECKSALMWQQCNCIPANWPRWREEWTECELAQLTCISASRANFTKQLNLLGAPYAYRQNRYTEQFLCDCLPACEFNQYAALLDVASLGWTPFSVANDLFAGISLQDHIIVHVHYGALIAERSRVDVYQNWLNFVGTFGGITGLFMGYSVVSAFEMIFFVFVRPACNWLTKKQIRYRIERKRRQKAKEAALVKLAQH